MAREVHKFSVTVPAGTPIATPQVTNLKIPARTVTSVEIVTPTGAHGLVGFALGAAGVPFIPYEPGAFIIADGEKIEWDLEDQILSGAWQIFAYNTGAFNHTLEIRFLVDLPRPPVTTASPLLSASVLSSR